MPQHHSYDRSKTPDLEDLTAAGLSLTDALAFWSEMMNSPRKDDVDWWAEISRAVSRSTSLPCPPPSLQ